MIFHTPDLTIAPQAVLPGLKRQPQSWIINVGSTFGSIGFPGYSGYCASKFGLRGFTEALRRELADTQVHTLYLAPRATRTAINSDKAIKLNQALGNQMDSPKRVARAFISQLERNQARVFIGFPESLFARVNALLPGVVDKVLKNKLAIIKQFTQFPS